MWSSSRKRESEQQWEWLCSLFSFKQAIDHSTKVIKKLVGLNGCFVFKSMVRCLQTVITQRSCPALVQVCKSARARTPLVPGTGLGGLTDQLEPLGQLLELCAELMRLKLA